MKKYRARLEYNDKPYSGKYWLTDDNHIGCTGAVVGSVQQIVNLIARMVEVNPGTVRNGTWTLESKHGKWVEVT